MSRMNEGQASQASQTFRDTAGQVSQTLRDAGSQVQEKIGQIRDQANEYYEQGKEQAREWEQGLEAYVQEKPIQSLLIAAGVGMLLGMLWKRS